MGWINTIPRRLPPRDVTIVTAWVLILGFLFQPVLTYLATPKLVVDSSGNTIVICTLKGLQTFDLGSDTGAEYSDQELCPALLLLQQAQNAQTSLPPSIPGFSLNQVTPVDRRPELEYSRPYFHAFLTRAPPVFS